MATAPNQDMQLASRLPPEDGPLFLALFWIHKPAPPVVLHSKK